MKNILLKKILSVCISISLLLSVLLYFEISAVADNGEKVNNEGTVIVDNGESANSDASKTVNNDEDLNSDELFVSEQETYEAEEIDEPVNNAEILTVETANTTATVVTNDSDYTYEVISEEEKTAKITGYTGTDTELIIPAEIDGYKITTIGRNTLYVNNTVTSIVISEGISIIDWSAFFNCKAMKTLTLPNSIEKIYDSAFYMPNLEDVYYSGTIDEWYSIYFGSGTSVNPMQYSQNEYFNGEVVTSFAIPESDTVVKANALYGIDSLENVTLHNKITIIEQCAFAECSGLKSIAFPDSLTEIWRSAFENSGLESISLPESVTKLGDRAFAGTAITTGIVYPNVYYSNGFTYANCENLKEIVYLEGVTAIPQGMFYDCSSLENVEFPSFIQTIGVSAFRGTGIKTLNIPDTVKTIGSAAFECCFSLTTAVIPEGITKLSFTFASCSKLVSVSLPSTLTEIGSQTFKWCSSLKSIEIPENVTTIGMGAFSGCNGLSEVIIPAKVTSIGNNAFYDCFYLYNVKVLATDITLGTNIFGDRVQAIYGFRGTDIHTYAVNNKHTFYSLGNMDNNTSIDKNDYDILVAYIQGTGTLTTHQKKIADINFDGTIDAYDAIYLDLVINGMI